MTASTAPDQPDERPAHWFKPGQSGNPKGRPAGSRNKLNEYTLRDFVTAWQARGVEAINRMIDEEPGDFVKVMASLLPKDVQISARPFTEFTDDQLLDALHRLESSLTASGSTSGAGETIEGEATVVVPSLPQAAAVPRGGQGIFGAPADGGESGG